MTCKERTRAVFSGKIPDRVPVFEQLVVSRVASAILGRPAITGGGEMQKVLIEALRHRDRNEFVEHYVSDVLALDSILDMDIIPVELMPPREIDPGEIPEEIAPGTYLYRDVFGKDTFQVTRFSPISGQFFVVDSSLRRDGLKALERFSEELSHKLSIPVTFGEGMWDAVDALREKLGNRKALALGQVISIPIDPVWLEALVTRRDLIEIHLDWQLKRSLALVEEASKRGIDFINGGGDLADKHGPIYSPRCFEELMLPRFEKLIMRCHELGLWYVFRTDGNIWPIVDLLFRKIGADGYGEIDVMAGMDLAKLKQRFPDLVLWGNLDCGKLLVEGTKEMIRSGVRECFEKGKPGGRYIFGSSNSIHWGIPHENFLWMREVAEEYRDY